MKYLATLHNIHHHAWFFMNYNISVSLANKNPELFVKKRGIPILTVTLCYLAFCPAYVCMCACLLTSRSAKKGTFDLSQWGNGGKATYAFSKLGLNAMTRIHQRELANSDKHRNTITNAVSSPPHTQICTVNSKKARASPLMVFCCGLDLGTSGFTLFFLRLPQ